jgi:hypothetical protein
MKKAIRLNSPSPGSVLRTQTVDSGEAGGASASLAAASMAATPLSAFHHADPGLDIACNSVGFRTTGPSDPSTAIDKPVQADDLALHLGLQLLRQPGVDEGGPNRVNADAALAVPQRHWPYGCSPTFSVPKSGSETP